MWENFQQVLSKTGTGRHLGAGGQLIDEASVLRFSMQDVNTVWKYLSELAGERRGL